MAKGNNQNNQKETLKESPKISKEDEAKKEEVKLPASFDSPSSGDSPASVSVEVKKDAKNSLSNMPAKFHKFHK